MEACDKGRLQIADTLIKNGADVNLQAHVLTSSNIFNDASKW
jgi:hypothetical protein